MDFGSAITTLEWGVTGQLSLESSELAAASVCMEATDVLDDAIFEHIPSSTLAEHL